MTIDGDNSPVDYIFGEMDQPQNAAKWMKERFAGVHHYSEKTPDAPEPNKAVVIKATTDTGEVYDELFIWFTIDEWQNIQCVPLTKHRLVWNSITWSYIQEWQVTIPPQAEGVLLRYKIGAKQPGSDEIVYTDNQSKSFDEATHYSIWFGKDNYPAWAEKAIVYQVFVDRFNPGKRKNWLQTSDIRKHYGGTLAGVIEKLPYLREMGFNAIWLSPIFESPSHHGYDTLDYFRINRRFGTLAEFKQLISEAHKLGIRVILDFVANHCSDEHPFFKDAVQNQNSAYHDWFVWKKWPEYESFYNVGSMPKLNLTYGSPAKEHLLEAARYWLEMGVDGYRLDYASGPEHDFWIDFKRVCTTVNPDIWTFGELVLPADIQACYADALGGSLDFILAQALRLTFGSQVWKLSKFAGLINSHFKYFPSNHSLPSFIDNHDMDRFYTIADDNPGRLKLALLILYMLPGPPIIYYGTETPLSQNHLLHDGGGLGFDEARLEMDWNNLKPSNLRHYLHTLAELREKLAFFVNNNWQIKLVDDAQQILIMETSEEKEILIINRSTDQNTVNISLKEDCGEYQDRISEEIYSFSDNYLSMIIQPTSGILLSAK